MRSITAVLGKRCGLNQAASVAVTQHMPRLLTRSLVCGFLSVVTIVTFVSAQVPIRAGAQRATREELAARATDLQRITLSSSAKKEAKAAAQAEFTAINARLTDGDFRSGDRIVVYITQDEVKMDSVSVRDSLKVSLGAFPDFSLHGILRSELDSKMGEFVARYLRNSRVRTIALTRVSVLGAVNRPGFYYAVPDRALSELVTMAGGPAGESRVEQLEIKRGDALVLSKKQAKAVLAEGRTLEQLDVQSGDEVRVPERKRFPWTQVIQFAFLGMSLFFAVIQFLQYYYSRKNQ